jgi:hypothetical protein
MTYRTIRIAAFCAALLVAALAFHAWLVSRDEKQRLQSTFAAQKQVIDAADARERSREATLSATLAQIDKLKRTTQTPAQILRDLPKYVPLPQPVALVRTADPAMAPPEQGTEPSQTRPVGSLSSPSASPPLPSPATSASLATTDLPSAPVAQIPAPDLKPLYDFVQDCRACDAQLLAAKQNAADDAAKIAALTRERDAAITAAKGGSFWRRLRRNTLWLAVGTGIGAAGGYAAAKR